jgi:hypothetical protein
MHILHQFIVPVGLFLLALFFGFWLSHTGKPYNGILFNFHKMLALGSVVLACIQLYINLHALNWLLITLLAVLALCIIALFISGSLMSVGKLHYNLMLTIHRIALVVLVLSCVLLLYGLGKIYCFIPC